MTANARLLCPLAVALLTAGLIASSPVGAEIAQKHGVRVSLAGSLTPKRLPRRGTAPVSFSVAGRIGSTGEARPPQLRTLRIEINRHGKLSARGLRLCRLGRIDPSTTREAKRACAAALVGTGSFSADVKLPEQSPFPSRGKVLAFNGRYRGHPAILAHIYGVDPVPTSYVLPFVIHNRRGTFGTVLEGLVAPSHRRLGLRHRHLDRARPQLPLPWPASQLPQGRLPRSERLRPRRLPSDASQLRLRQRPLGDQHGDPHLPGQGIAAGPTGLARSA